jgi:hypothetical protein
MPKPETVRPEILSGWKDIANYLGKGVRTVQRYGREMGLPIHRPAGMRPRGGQPSLFEQNSTVGSRLGIAEAIQCQGVGLSTGKQTGLARMS